MKKMNFQRPNKTPQPETCSHGVKYRAEIDGLRAVAVLAVVFYHASITLGGIRFVPGGFFGVDIFFVISGYLIGFNVLSEVRNGKFSMAGFLERRVRRIVPALYVMLAGTLAASWFLVLNRKMMEVAESVLATVTLWSNIYFWQQGGYAADANSLKPLIHTWSLSVEEQFYLLLPGVTLLCIRWRPRAMMPVLLLGTLGSFALCILVRSQWPSATFYLFPTRSWELLFGFVLACAELGRGSRGNFGGRVGFVAVAAGLLAILFSIAVCDENDSRPGMLTLLPVFGTALVIWFGGNGDRVSRWLSTSPLVAIGLISYSLYLWHQPIFALTRHFSVDALGLGTLIGLIAISFVVGSLSWKFVEQPFRHRRAASRRWVWGLFGGGATLLVFASSVVIVGRGFPDRFPNILATGDPPSEFVVLGSDGRPCHRTKELPGCHFEIGGPGTGWVLIGDSHASVLGNSLLDGLGGRVRSLDVFTSGGCPVIFDVDYMYPVKGDPIGCQLRNEFIRERLRELPPSIVVYAARMGAWLEGTRFDNGEGGVEPGQMDLLVPVTPGQGDRINALIERVTSTIQTIMEMGHTVILVYPVPEVGWHVPETLRKIIPQNQSDVTRFFQEEGLTTSLSRYFERNQKAFAAYDALGEDPRLLRVYPHQLFCSDTTCRCSTHDDKSFFYSDDDHLSSFGARLLVGRILEIGAPGK